MEAKKTELTDEIQKQKKNQNLFKSHLIKDISKLSDTKADELHGKEKQLLNKLSNAGGSEVHISIGALTNKISHEESSFANKNFLDGGIFGGNIDIYWLGKNSQLLDPKTNPGIQYSAVGIQDQVKKLNAEKISLLSSCAKIQKTLYQKHLKTTRAGSLDEKMNDLSELLDMNKQQLENINENVSSKNGRTTMLVSRKERLHAKLLSAKDGFKNVAALTST